MKITKESFERTLGPNIKFLAQISIEGFRDYGRKYATEAPAHSKRSVASLRHDHMIEQAGRVLPAEFRRIKCSQRILFEYGSKLLIQFNKLDGGDSDLRRVTKNPSIQTQLFDEGSVDCLPGIPAALPLITVGYTCDETGSVLKGVYAVHLVESNPEWAIKLNDDEAGGGVATMTHPTNDPQPRRDRIKKPDQQEEQKRNPG